MEPRLVSTVKTYRDGRQKNPKRSKTVLCRNEVGYIVGYVLTRLGLSREQNSIELPSRSEVVIFGFMSFRSRSIWDDTAHSEHGLQTRARKTKFEFGATFPTFLVRFSRFLSSMVLAGSCSLVLDV